MSAYTSLHYSRQEAISYIQSKLGEASPKELEGMMDILLDKQLYNCVIDEYWTEDAEAVATVTVTYQEIFRRCNGYQALDRVGVSQFYLNEGGDPKATRVLTKKEALAFMDADEFNGRKN